MLLDVTRVFKNLDGDDVQDVSEDDGTKKPLTIRSVLCSVLVTSVQGDTSSKPAEHVERFMLALKIRAQDKVELSSEQVTDIKKWTATRYAPLITGQLCMILEGKLDETDAVDEAQDEE